LEIVEESSIQTVGIRFQNVTISRGSKVIRAHIQFRVDEVDSEFTSFEIHTEAQDNTSTFTSARYNIYSRNTSRSAAYWSPPPWLIKGNEGLAQQTSDLSSILQETIERPGWVSGNAVVFIITGIGKRVAVSHDDDRAGAPLLVVEYTDDPSPNPSPTPSPTPSPNLTPSPTPVPTSPSFAKFVSSSVPSSVDYEQDLILQITYKNDGTETWTKDTKYILRPIKTDHH